MNLHSGEGEREKERAGEQQVSFLWFKEPPASLYMQLEEESKDVPATQQNPVLFPVFQVCSRVSIEIVQ